MNLTQKRLLDIAQYAVFELEGSEYEHEAILDYLQINEEEYKTIVKADNNTKHYVYMLQIDYSTDNCQGVETHIFATRYQAVEKFKEQIEFEKKQTWIQDAYENDKLLEGYELDQNTDDDNDTDLWWNMSCHHDFYLRTFIDMKKMEVK